MATPKTAYPREIDVRTEVDSRKIQQARKYSLFVEDNDIEQAIVDLGCGGKVHSPSGISAI